MRADKNVPSIVKSAIDFWIIELSILVLVTQYKKMRFGNKCKKI